MLAIFVCQCASGELKARRVLKEAGVKNYLGIKCYIGKENIYFGMDKMPESIRNTTEWKSMRRLIGDKSSYAVVAGWDDSNFRWSDIYDGRIESIVPGKKIAEYFAKN